MSLPIRVRLTLWYAAVLAITLLGVEVFLVTRLHYALIAGIDETLAVKAEAIAEALQGPGETEFRSGSNQHLPEMQGREIVAQLLSPKGDVLQAGGEGVPQTALVGRTMLARGQANPVRETIRLAGHPYADRVLLVPIRQDGSPPLILAVSRSLQPAEGTIHRVILLVAASTPPALALAAVGGWLLARGALRPVDQMTRAAAAIDASAHELLPVPAHEDELSRLAQTLNAMVGRLRRAIDEERRFTADASHEFRTPLSVMQTELDVMLRSADTPEAARVILRSVREEVTALARVVDNLLVLARADAAGRVELSPRRLDLFALVQTVEAKFRRLAEARGVRLCVGGDTTEAEVDPDRMSQVVANLLDNGIKYTEPGGEVRITVRNAGEPQIEISDTGVGIPAELLPRIFDRFYRVDASRSRSSGGAGLGLAIVRQLVVSHGGRIEVRSQPERGTTFLIRLPGTPLT
jgi:heavy metal sensor kinase